MKVRLLDLKSLLDQALDSGAFRVLHQELAGSVSGSVPYRAELSPHSTTAIMTERESFHKVNFVSPELFLDYGTDFDGSAHRHV